MPQPPFWLKVTPAYVIENFEDMLSYVSQYNYTAPEPLEGDFNRTVDCLCQVAQTLIDECNRCNLDEMPKWNVDPDLALRIVGVAITAQHKRGITPYDLIVGLIEMLSYEGLLQTDLISKYVNILNGCARRLKLKSFPLGFRLFEQKDFSGSKLSLAISKMEWVADSEQNSFFEGFGTIIFRPDGVEIVPQNHDDVNATMKKRKRLLDLSLGIYISDKDKKKVNAESARNVLTWVPELSRALSSVRPSRRRVLKSYSSGDALDVKIVRKQGIRLECISIDPDYQQLKGNLLLDSNVFGIPKDILLAHLKEGVILPAVYYPNDNCIFHISSSKDEEREFKNFVKGDGLADVKAMFLQDYQYGTRWLTETGLQVNVLADNNDLIDFETFHHDGACVNLTVHEVTFDSKGKVVANGNFVFEQNEDDVEQSVFEREAYNSLARTFIEWLNSSSNEETEEKEDILIGSNVPNVLAKIILRNACDNHSLSAAERVSRMLIALALFTCIGNKTEQMIAQRELAFQNVAISFAEGKSPSSLEFNPDEAIAGSERTKRLYGIVATLRTYKESFHSLGVSESLLGEQYDQIKDLVSASNTLIDKIDASEISRIKKTIAGKLGVADTFRDVAHSHSYYGVESDTLEFKISCALPPQGLSSGNQHADIDTQAYVILKAVCAFLNSPSGGDLLIGVNDDGYGVGIANDIDILSSHKLIAERSADRVRIYVKNLIDSSFQTNDKSVAGNAITAGNVLVNVEATADGKQILRVKVNPYPYDVVRICAKRVPDKVKGKDVFFRSSGCSEPLDSAGVRNTRMNKLKALGSNEYKLALVLEAIDSKKQLMIKGYRSHSGTRDRKIEPHCLMPDNASLQAFDHRSREMRMFRLSRMTNLEKLNSNWEYERKHRTLEVDIFGMCQSSTHPGSKVILKMTEFAHMLLLEEFPAASKSNLFTCTDNTDADRRDFPVKAELTIFDPAGLLRFTRGLPEETKASFPDN